MQVKGEMKGASAAAAWPAASEVLPDGGHVAGAVPGHAQAKAAAECGIGGEGTSCIFANNSRLRVWRQSIDP
jgi:hypothetical protein